MSSILIETDEERADDVDPPVAISRPPRPEHRRVYTSLFFTIAILAGTVFAVYWLFPERHHVLATSAAAHHRAPPTAWDLTSPSPGELHAWLIGVVGENAPLPPSLDRTPAIGAETVTVLGRRAAMIRLRAGTDEITYVVARARGVGPRWSHKDSDLRLVEWSTGPWARVVIGPDATSATWMPLVGAP